MPKYIPSLGIIEFSAGNFFLASADTFRETCSTGPIKLKEIQIGRGGTLRIYFELRTNDAGKTAYAQIYRNGSPVGTQRSNSSTSFVSFTEDISGWSVGDYVQLYTWVTANYYSGVKNFRIYVESADKANVTLD
jgi:hypothetical protein